MGTMPDGVDGDGLNPSPGLCHSAMRAVAAVRSGVAASGPQPWAAPADGVREARLRWESGDSVTGASQGLCEVAA